MTDSRLVQFAVRFAIGYVIGKQLRQYVWVGRFGDGVRVEVYPPGWTDRGRYVIEVSRSR